jgi:tetratricopeptide (TPR) repeat protein
MKRPQWFFLGSSLLLTVLLFAATQKQFFGNNPRQAPATGNSAAAATASGTLLSIDTILFHAKEELTPAQLMKLTELEKGIVRGDVRSQQLHALHQLARFWKDSARLFAPFAWYTGEAARLENSENSLTFAARLFLQGLKEEQNPQLKQWEALQAKDLFERSLKINPANDSNQVFLGETYIYGGAGSPMEGIGKIRSVLEKDSTNLQALIALGEASLVSGQLDKAVERFSVAARLAPAKDEYALRVADVYERMNKKAEAIQWYEKSLPLITIPELKQEVEKRISQLRQ